MNVVVQSTLPHSHHEALERLTYFNGQQAHAEGAIVQAIDQYGSLDITSAVDGLRVSVSHHPDAQCLFALVSRRGRIELGGGLIYLRTSREELVVLHIAVADRYSRRRRVALHLIMRLIRAVRVTAHRLRGVNRVSMLYKKSRRLRIVPGGPPRGQGTPRPEEKADQLAASIFTTPGPYQHGLVARTAARAPGG